MSAQGIRAGKAFVEVGANSAPLDAALLRLRGKLTRFGKGLAAVGAGLLAAGAGVAASLAWPLKLAADLEQTHAGFLTMLGDAALVKQLMSELQQFAASTPFQLDELNDAARMMLAFGSSADTVVDELRMLGDIASGVGMPLGELAEIYGKNRVQGRLFGEDINQLTGRGIPVIQELAKQFGVTEGEVKNLVSEGKVGFADLQTAMETLATTGIFAGGMDRQSKTLLGLWSTLKDTIAQAVLPIGEALLPVMVDVVKYTTDAVKAAGEFIKPWLNAEVAMAGLNVAWQLLLQDWYSVTDAISDYWTDASNGIAAAGAQAVGFLRQAWQRVITWMGGMIDYLQTKLKTMTNTLIGLMTQDPATARYLNEKEKKAYEQRQARRTAQGGLNVAEIGSETAEYIKVLADMAEAERSARLATRSSDLTSAQQRLADAQKRLQELQAAQAAEDKAGAGGPKLGPALDDAKQKSAQLAGTFNATLAAQQAGIKQTSERTAKATERTAKAAEKMAKEMGAGAGILVGG